MSSFKKLSLLAGKRLFRIELLLLTPIFVVIAPDAAWAPPALVQGSWQGWQDIGGGNVGRAPGPECLSRTAGVIDCFAVQRLQQIAQLERKTFDATTGEMPWSPLPGESPLVFDSLTNGGFEGQRPSCLSITPVRFDCFVLGTVNNTRSLHHIWQDGPAKGWWEDIGLGDQFTSYPSCASENASIITCFARATDGSLKERFWNSQNWTSFSLEGSIAAGSAPVCVAWRSGPSPADARTTCVIESTVSSPNGDVLILRAISHDQNGFGSWIDIPMGGVTLATDFPLPSQPKCVANAFTLFCVAWTTKADGTKMLARFKTHNGQNWSTFDDLADDLGATLESNFGGLLGSAFDCFARGTNQVECIEIVARGFRDPVSHALGNPTLHLRLSTWSETSFGRWSNVESLTSPPVSTDFDKLELRCIGSDSGDINCFTVPLLNSPTTPAPVFRASFTPPPIHHLPGH